MKLQVTDTLAGVDAGEWNSLAGGDPFLQHAFLHGLHETGCACADTGWAPQYLLLRDNAGRLAGAMPLYLKSHSYGEYVFDWAWADAYQRHGLEYYPKLLCAVPFTPVAGARLLAAGAEQRRLLAAGALELARDYRLSSLHVLYPREEDLVLLQDLGLLTRQGRQFHWHNAGYTDFEHFLAALSHDKRKKIRQERRKVREAGVRFDWVEGTAISGDDWQFFTRCYLQTYREHHATPYLNLGFFRHIGAAMAQHLVLVRARIGDRAVAASLLVRGADRLYGRHWGAVEHLPLLHFETCYYQGIEYAIARGLRVFEGGAQGVHKMARGLMPVATQSAHWLARPEFADAVARYLERETAMMDDEARRLAARSPFREV